MLSIGGSQGGVATSAYFIADIPHIGTYITIRGIEVEGRIIRDWCFLRLARPFRNPHDKESHHYQSQQHDDGAQCSSQAWRFPAAKRLGILHYASLIGLVYILVSSKRQVNIPISTGTIGLLAEPTIVPTSKTRLDFPKGTIKMRGGRNVRTPIGNFFASFCLRLQREFFSC